MEGSSTVSLLSEMHAEAGRLSWVLVIAVLSFHVEKSPMHAAWLLKSVVSASKAGKFVSRRHSFTV